MNSYPAGAPGSSARFPTLTLTPREHDILKLMSEDLTNGQIAERLVVTLDTVKWYARQIYNKLGVHSRDEAVEVARERHLLRTPALVEQASTETPSYIPVPSTPLIGRETELTQLTHYFTQEGVRLVTIVGAPGMGKTRLSLQVGEVLRPHFADGVFFVALASLTDPLLVPHAIANAMNLDVGTLSANLLKNALRLKHTLLVLDNFEHLMEAAPLVGELLDIAPRLHVLVTSRETLQLSAEQQYVLTPLAVPKLARTRELTPIAESPAVELFVQRAQAVKHTFAIHSANADTIARICTRLEGLPLAIELAAARTKVLSPAELLEGLTSRLDLLKSPLRDRAARQQTLRGAIDWSYAPLNDDEKMLFNRISVFSGGCTLETVWAVCGSNLAVDLLDVLESLVNKSLLHAGDSPTGGFRITMLEMLREYALEKLAQAGELDTARREHAHYFAALTVEAASSWHTPTQMEWLDRMEADIDNLRAALAWSLEHEPTVAAQMAVNLWMFWSARGYHGEADRIFRQILQMAVPFPAVLRANVLVQSSLFAYYVGDHARAVQQMDAALGLALAEEDALLLTRVYGMFANIHSRSPELAQQYAEEALRAAHNAVQTTTVQRDVGAALLSLGSALIRQGNYAEGKAKLLEGRALRQQMGDELGVALSTHSLAHILSAYGEIEEAEGYLHQARPIAERYRLRGLLAASNGTLAEWAAARGDYAEAIRYGETAVHMFKEKGHNNFIPQGFLLANAYRLTGSPQRAARLLVDVLDMALMLGENQRLYVAVAVVQAALLRLDQGDGARAVRWLRATQPLHHWIKIDPEHRLTSSWVLEAEAKFRQVLGDAEFERAYANTADSTLEQAAHEARHMLSNE